MIRLARTGILSAATFLVVAGAALGQARFLSFPDELRRARSAIGPDAECRILIEEVLARCELKTAGAHAIQVQFADISGSLLPRKSIILVRGAIEPQQFTGVLAAYNLPPEVTVRCTATEPGRAAYEVYVGDFLVSCDRDTVTISYAKRF